MIEPVAELLPRESDTSAIELVQDPEHFVSTEAVLDRLSQQAHVAVPRILSRKAVEQGFLHAFDAIGGTSRLALWANENPGKFYELLTRLFPKEVTAKVQGGLVLQHALQKNPKLDEE